MLLKDIQHPDDARRARGLAAGGQAGVEHVVRSFLAELDLTTALCGARRPTDVELA